jgi:hypothetical protein
MDNPNPFSLNDAIRRWQQDLGASPAFCADNLEELASHLRASAQRLKASGLSEEESFLIAFRRLGGVDKLSCEFSKLNFGLVWQARAFWMLAGMLVYLAVSALAKLASTAIMALCGHFVANGFLLGWIGGGICVSVIVGAGLLLRLVAAGRLTGITFSMARLLQRPRIALPVLFCGAIALKMAAVGAEAVLFHGLSPMAVGQALVINAWLNSIGGLVIILLIVVALTRPVLSRHAPANGFFIALMLFTSGLAFVATGCGKATPPPAVSGQTIAEQTIASWKSDTNAAVEKFMEIDWSQRPLFATGDVLGYSEAQFAAIPASARETMSKQMTADLQTVKMICSAVNARGRDALAKGDQATAERCFNQLKECGQALDGPDSLLLLKMTGQAINKQATGQLAALKK